MTLIKITHRNSAVKFHQSQEVIDKSWQVFVLAANVMPPRGNYTAFSHPLPFSCSRPAPCTLSATSHMWQLRFCNEMCPKYKIYTEFWGLNMKKKSVILIMITCWDDNTFWCQKLSFSVHWCQIKSCRQFRVKQKRITLLLCQAKGGHSRLKPSNHVSSLGEDSEKFYINCLYVFVDWKLGPCPKGSLDCFSSSRIPSLP